MNARTREEIGYVPCTECGAKGWYQHPDGIATCLECLGSKRMLAETPRLAVQRHEGGKWRTLLRVDGDDYSAAQTYRETYEKETPGKYRIVSEVDEDYNPAPSKVYAGFGTYAEQMRDAGRGHLLRGDE